jgi:predicted amidohydrolase YtcJ
MKTFFAVMALALAKSFAGDADLILHGGKVVAVDERFSIHQAVAVKGDKILRVGSDGDVLKERGDRTEVIDLKGRMVLPGLIDSHSHAADAAMVEFDHPIPQMETIADVLAYIRERARVVKEGDWIEVRQVFITRLKEQRYPTLQELNEAAPKHPVIFATGPDAMLNSMAMKVSGIDRDFKVTDGGSGFAEKDAKGEPTGVLRNASRYVKVNSTKRTATSEDRVARLKTLFADYNSVGLTMICDRNASPGGIEIYQRLKESGRMTVRTRLSHQMASIGKLEEIEERIRSVAKHPLFTGGDDLLRIIGIKMFLDGGMLTGSAYMREPWGVSEIYSITDPQYRGVLFIPKERLVPMVRAALGSGLQFTAHSVGDGAVQTLVETYDELAREKPIGRGMACISHSNFMTREAVETAARLGVMMDIQPAWLYLDSRTLEKQFGYDRLRYFQPLKSIFENRGIVGGGSDHMQKVGSMRSVNPYNPFLGMATAVTRRAKDVDHPMHMEEALSREQAIRYYTINNAKILRCEEKLGSLEVGKLADLVVLDTDLLTCPDEKIVGTRAVRTYVGGKLVYSGQE